MGTRFSRLRAHGLIGLAALAAGCLPACTPTGASTTSTTSASGISAGPGGETKKEAFVPVHIEDVPVPGDLPALIVRGARAHRVQMVFIPGMCVHPGGYVSAFQHTAASRGDLVAVQGDVSCGGDGSMRRWSNDLVAMDRRIDAALAATGVGAPRDVVLIGYSQGAERIERLVAKWPEKYSRVVLMASPTRPSARVYARANAVVLMAGTHDMSRGTMRSAVVPMTRAKIPATFIEIPDAHHGSMGNDPETMMKSALDFVEHASRERDDGLTADAPLVP